MLSVPATFLRRPPPRGATLTRPLRAGPAKGNRIAGLHPNTVQALICVAGFSCCIPMAVPSAHIVAFCGDIGIRPTHGAAMLSVMLGSAFLARQLRGALACRIGGRRTGMAGGGSPGPAARALRLH